MHLHAVLPSLLLILLPSHSLALPSPDLVKRGTCGGVESFTCCTPPVSSGTCEFPPGTTRASQTVGSCSGLPGTVASCCVYLGFYASNEWLPKTNRVFNVDLGRVIPRLYRRSNRVAELSIMDVQLSGSGVAGTPRGRRLCRT